MSDNQLPDGVERDRDVNEYGVEYGLWTRIEGHGRVREMWAVVRETGSVVSVWNTATDAQNASYFCSMPVEIRRVIVIECDAAPAKE